MRDLFYLDGFWYVATRKDWVFSVLLKTKSELEARLFYQRLHRAERDRVPAEFYRRGLPQKSRTFFHPWEILLTTEAERRNHGH